MKNCSVGMFKLPGISFDKNQITEELANEMEEWCKENKCGTRMTDRLWSFKSEKKRDWFILRWSDSIPKETSDGSAYLMP
jgi:hypothetical protein